ncbi:HAD-like domain-containing protein [Phlebopus sp. FC_14]|nr:HAD-like domain-containing protein [Phlebopus sp. FC_14]
MTIPITDTALIARREQILNKLIEKKPKFLALSDWDGTITDRDSNDCLTDELANMYQERREWNRQTVSGEKTFKETFDLMLKGVAKGYSFSECKDFLVKHIKLDSGFLDFYKYCKSQDIPLVIVSSGMDTLIRGVLTALDTENVTSELEIISNGVEEHDGTWNIKWIDPEGKYGHDKSRAILPFRELGDERPTLIFFGDGVSDMSAAQHADVLFVKIKSDGEHDLQDYCQNEGISHILFDNFSAAQKVVASMVEQGKSPEEVLQTYNGKSC